MSRRATTGSAPRPEGEPTMGAGEPIAYSLLASRNAGPIPPATVRVPAGWSTLALVQETEVVLEPAASALASPATRAWFRLTTAIDDRVQRFIDVGVPGGRQVGVLDLRYAHALEMFELALTGADVVAALRYGVTLRLRGEGAPLWFLASGGGAATPLPPEFHPHLMTTSECADPVAGFHRRFASLASLQGFGWMEGCVLDGLRGLECFAADGARYRAAREAHWQTFAGRDGGLTYESPRSVVCTDRVYGIEGGLPFADLALRDPRHRWLNLFATAMSELRRPDGAIQDADVLSAEGSLTVAFPLAALAIARDSDALAAIALDQLRIRQARLWHEDALWLRCMDDGQRSFRNWARAVAWHLLGLVRTLELLRDRVPEAGDLEAAAREVGNWVQGFQRDDGLWPAYVDDPRLAADTSGSAGIAAALALGARIGVLPSAVAGAARRALVGLQGYLTPDGFLGGATQANRGGEILQRSDYRVLSQMAMGLQAQLVAELSALGMVG